MTIPDPDVTTQNFETPSTYARVSWTPEDVLEIFDMTLEEAENWLSLNERHIADSMVQHGWEVIETLGACDMLNKVKDDDQT